MTVTHGIVAKQVIAERGIPAIQKEASHFFRLAHLQEGFLADTELLMNIGIMPKSESGLVHVVFKDSFIEETRGTA